jgi:hypothetical protein
VGAVGSTVISKGDLAVSLLNGEVDEFTPSGTFVQKLITSADGLGLPTGSAFDGNGNLYVTDFTNNQILKREALTGAVSVVASNTTLGNGHAFNAPESTVFNRGYSQMFVSDANRDGPGGGINVVDTATGGGVAFYPLPSSQGSEGAGEADWLAFDANSNLFMTNENPTQGVMKVDANTGDVVQPSFAPNLPDYGYALSFDKNGNLWVGDTSSILEYDPSGATVKTITNPSFSLIFSAVFNPAGDQFYAGDLNTGSVYTYALSGNLLGSFSAGSGVSGLSVAGAVVPPNTAGLTVTPTKGLPGTNFSASWSCAVGAPASIKVTDSAGNVVLPGQLPVSGNGADYVDGFQAAIPPGDYVVTASCGGTPLPSVSITVLAGAYVALGDSFASGEGADVFFPDSDQPGTDMCHRARSGYAVLASDQLHYERGSTFDFAACSGAVIPDLYHANSQNRTEIAQRLHLSPATKLVTFSIGGNDVGFRDVLTDCLDIPPALHLFAHTGGRGCARRNASSMAAALSWLKKGRGPGCYQLPGINPDTGKPETVCGSLPSLTQVYEDIHAAAPNAKILVLGYPELWGSKFDMTTTIPPSCEVLKVGGLTGLVYGSDADWMNEVGLRLNKIIGDTVHAAAAATSANIQVVSVDTAFEGHRLCDTGVPWFNHIILDRDGIHISPDPRSIHPNDSGQQNGYFARLSPRL